MRTDLVLPVYSMDNKKILIIGGSGYIGSFLRQNLPYELSSVDIEWFDKNDSINVDFNSLSESYLSEHEVVILLAAHSSVKMCQGDFINAFNNNVVNFLKLLNKIKSINKRIKFIYASSSSVYGDVGSNKVDENYHEFIPHNHYDITKHIIDLYAPKFDISYYGLRFGTVNGYSPILRNDVMINSMVYNGIKNKEIKLYIKDIIRPILAINDLSRAIKNIIDTKEDHRGIYNLSSFNGTAEWIANKVSKVLDIPVVEYKIDPNNITNSKLQTKCYNFSIDSSKFMNTFDFKFNETVENITGDLVSKFNNMTFTSRNEFKQYE